MDFFQAFILGIIEGVTEFLPISSTGHLILASKLLGIKGEFAKTFEIAIQLGAIFSVAVLYAKLLLNSFETWKRIIVAFIPTGIIGLAFYKIVKKYLLGNEMVVVWTLFIGGIIIILFELWESASWRRKGKKIEDVKDNEDITAISLKQSFLIGIFQSFAIIPGLSRSAATIIGGLLLGIDRKTIVKFSFLLAFPTMLAATGLDLLKSAGEFSSNDWGALAVGLITSFIVAIFSIKFLLRFIEKHTFISFGIYRIIIAILFFIFVL